MLQKQNLKSKFYYISCSLFYQYASPHIEVIFLFLYISESNDESRAEVLTNGCSYYTNDSH